jgi:hypothetical protein
MVRIEKDNRPKLAVINTSVRTAGRGREKPSDTFIE